MPSLSKTSQLKRVTVTKKICDTCNKEKLLKYFSSSRATECQLCKAKRWRDSLKAKTKAQVAKAKVKQPRLSDLKKEVQKKINRIVRDRDASRGCISCKNGSIEHAGHYVPQGSSGALRFDLKNINGQCNSCNVWKHGNLIEYRINLVKKIGLEQVEWLEEHRHDVKKWTRDELLALLG